jgi:hypothetical protein
LPFITLNFLFCPTLLWHFMICPFPTCNDQTVPLFGDWSEWHLVPSNRTATCRRARPRRRPQSSWLPKVETAHLPIFLANPDLGKILANLLIRWGESYQIQRGRVPPPSRPRPQWELQLRANGIVAGVEPSMVGVALHQMSESLPSPLPQSSSGRRSALGPLVVLALASSTCGKLQGWARRCIS